MVVEVYECPKCHRSVRLEGPSKQALIAHFKEHVLNCSGPPPTPSQRTFHAQSGNGRTGILSRVFKRPTRRRPQPAMTANASRKGITQMLTELEALDDAYMADLHPPPPEGSRPPAEKVIEALPPEAHPPIDPAVETQGHHFLRQGFDFTQKSAILNFREFQKVREEFLLQSRMVALTQLYSVFFLSFVDYHYGYGMNDHKKHNWLLGMSEIREDLEHLKGQAQQGIWDPEYEGIIELRLNVQFETMIAAHTMDTKSAREHDKHERLLEMAKAMIAQSEEKGELRNLMDELEGKDKEGAT